LIELEKISTKPHAGRHINHIVVTKGSYGIDLIGKISMPAGIKLKVFFIYNFHTYK